MQRLYFALVLFLTGCVEPYYQQQYTAPQPPTVTEIQAGCFASRVKFLDQTSCIQTALSNGGLNPYYQEYLAYMQSLQDKVQQKSLSENDARAKLTTKHNELRAQQQNELAVQGHLENQRAAQNAELLKQYQYKPVLLEMPQRRSPVLSSPTHTNCQAVGNQVNCTSR